MQLQLGWLYVVILVYSSGESETRANLGLMISLVVYHGFSKPNRFE